MAPATLPFPAPPFGPDMVLSGARVPAELVEGPVLGVLHDAEGALALDVTLRGGLIAAIGPVGSSGTGGPRFELDGRQVWPAFVDMHVHLDKGHVLSRVAPDGTVATGLSESARDWVFWTAEDLALRMGFGLACARAHGVAALRTHLDSVTVAQARQGFAAFERMRREWAGRVELHGVCGTPFSAYLDPAGREIADIVAAAGGVLGGVPDGVRPDADGGFDHLEPALVAMFRLAAERGLDVDLHVDPSDDPTIFTLPVIARARLRSGFAGRVTCGHCATLALQPHDVIEATATLAAEAGLAFAVMPTPMMYLMDRRDGRTPRWRGVTAAKELRARGLPVAVGGDNCRDAWFRYGDHDMLDTLKQAIRLLQLDEPLTGTLAMGSRVPADLIGRPDLGRLRVGSPADLVVFRARTVNAVLCRDQADRIVLSKGRVVTDPLPDHDDLDAALAALRPSGAALA